MEKIEENSSDDSWTTVWHKWKWIDEIEEEKMSVYGVKFIVEQHTLHRGDDLFLSEVIADRGRRMTHNLKLKFDANVCS